MLGARTVPWAPRRTHQGSLAIEPFLVDWVRSALKKEKDALQKVGIYEAVFLSLFQYNWDVSFFRSLVERWNYVSNTVILEDRELTISPMELHHLSGLPVFGAPYDEYSPKNRDFERLPGGAYRYPASLKRLFKIY